MGYMSVRVFLISFIAAIMVVWSIMVGNLVARAEPPECGVDTPGACRATLPPLPPLPRQLVNGDGSRMDCTPTYTYCWPVQ